MQDDIQSSSKFAIIVKKAKEKRSSKEKLLNSSLDGSFKSLQQKKKKNLLQSFVMRQTVALSAKNKQLTNALIQSRQTSSELDKNLQKMQERLMAIFIKLNSREVALKNCSKELEITKKALHRLQSREDAYNNFYSRLHDLIKEAPTSSEACSENETASVVLPQPKELNCDSQARRIPVLKPYSVGSQPSKWKPNLSNVLEKVNEDTSFETSPLLVCPDATDNINENLQNNSGDEFNLSIEGDSIMLNSSLSDNLRFDDDDGDDDNRSRKNRRRSSRFSASSFDPDQANFHLSDSDEDAEKLKSNEEQLESNKTELNQRSNNISEDICESSSDSASENNQTTVTQSEKTKIKKSSATKKKNFSNTSHGDNSILYLNQSMNLTNPVETEIVVLKPKLKAKNTRKRVSKPKKKLNLKKSDERAPMEKDVYNCSSDSFLLNPEKKIELSIKSKPHSKSKSLPMSNITNEIEEDSASGRRSRRRTAACVSYKEPSLNKKMRQGDSFFPNSLSP